MLVNINNISYNPTDFSHISFRLKDIIEVKDRIDKDYIPVCRTNEDKYICLNANACLSLEIQKMMGKKQAKVEIRK
jgi:hypothetical protein